MVNADTPLGVEIVDDVLVIKVGVNVVQWAAENMDANNPFDDETNAFKRIWRITDAKVFAEDVRHALLAEEEDGLTSLTKLLDYACLIAIENGSEGVDEVQDSKETTND
jgi:hypothetical protein